MRPWMAFARSPPGNDRAFPQPVFLGFDAGGSREVDSAAPSCWRLLGVFLCDQRQRQEKRLRDIGVLAAEMQPGHSHGVICLRVGILVDGSEDLAVVDQLADVRRIVADDELDLVPTITNRKVYGGAR